MNVKSATITGASAVVALSTALPQIAGYVAGAQLRAKWIQLAAPSGSPGILIGGPEVTSSVGYPIAAGTGLLLSQYGADYTEWYDLSEINVYVPTSSTLDILWGD
jgi:hypothetical protein